MVVETSHLKERDNAMTVGSPLVLVVETSHLKERETTEREL